MAKFNIMKAINDNIEKVNTRYDIGINEVNEILANSKGQYDIVYNSFTIGYIQGMKAVKAEMRKAGVN